MSEHTTQVSGGIGIGGLTFIVLLVLKLTGTIDISWFWVTFPLWIGLALVAAILLVVMAVVLVVQVVFRGQ